MNAPYLEVTFRGGRPLAAYLYLSRRAGDFAARTKRTPSGLVIDFAADGRAIGIEMTSPSRVTLEAVNEALSIAQQPPVRAEDLAPLRAA